MVVAGSADVWVEDRDGIGGPTLPGLAIELVVEDRAHRAVGERADLDGTGGRRFERRPDVSLIWCGNEQVMEPGSHLGYRNCRWSFTDAPLNLTA